MKYYDTKEDYLAHAQKGWTKSNHKYVSRYFKNGRWQYVYKNAVNAISNAARYAKNADGKKYNVGGYGKEKEYYTLSKNGKVHTKEITARGNTWLSRKVTLDFGDRKVIYNEHGKIRQAAESAINRGAAFIDALSKKKK